MRVELIEKQELSKGNSRFEGKFHLNDNALNVRVLLSSGFEFKELQSFGEVFNPPIFKRQFCNKTDRAIPYRKSHDIISIFEEATSYISNKQVQKHKLNVELNWILITGFGTEIGNVGLVTEDLEGDAFANNVCRVIPHNLEDIGFLVAFLKSKYGRSQFNKNASGSAIRYIEAPGIRKTLVPILSSEVKEKINKLIWESISLRIRANKLAREAKQKLKDYAGLPNLKNIDFEYFGNHSADRPISTFTRNINEISSVSINAFNYSKRVEELEQRVRNNKHLALSECIDKDQFFSSGSFKRLELDSPNSIKLINQSDISHLKKRGKMLARKFVKADRLVEYGEVIIAGVGTLAESETFCRAFFANEELEGQLISGEFIRMKTNSIMPSGYLFAWLSSDYGFRLIRKTHTGTKLCRPIPELLKSIPVPVISNERMIQIDSDIKKAQTLQFEALCSEEKAIKLVEKEIESWQN